MMRTFWSDIDCWWFCNHPDRSHRLRPLFDGEPVEDKTVPPLGCGRLVIVRQVNPGVVHEYVDFVADLEDEIPDHEAVLWALFDMIGEGGPILPDQFEARVRQYDGVVRLQ